MSPDRDKTRLTFGFSQNRRLAALVDGSVRAADLDLEMEIVHPYELFLRMLQKDDFDVSEFAIVDYLKTRELGGERWKWVGLPVFLSRAFLWFDLYVRADSDIRCAADLRGKRIAVPDYTMAATLCMRITLRHLYGICPDEIVWFNTRPQQFSLGGNLGLTDPAPGGVHLTWPDSERVLPMLLSGELDAAYGDGYAGPNLPGTRLNAQPGIRPLFPDRGKSVVLEFASRTGAVLANHMVIVQQRVARTPGVLNALFDLFERAKQLSYARDRHASALFPGTDLGEQRRIFGADPFPLGIEPNRRMLELLIAGAREEGWLTRPVDMAAAFWEPGR